MLNRRAALAAAAAVAVAASATALAQAPQETSFITYIEAGPKNAKAALSLVADYRDAAAKAPGILQIDALQRVGTPNHFAIVETWSSEKAQADFAATKEAKDFRSGLAPLLTAPYDERKHVALSVGPKAKQNGAIYAVTHVDIIPPKKDEGVASVKSLAENSRKATDVLRFDALTQVSRPNHMTIVESWKSKSAKDNFTATKGIISFREGLLPMSGSLYDERLYTRVK
jgi:quinol monooxygenase YgiN